MESKSTCLSSCNSKTAIENSDDWSLKIFEPTTTSEIQFIYLCSWSILGDGFIGGVNKFTQR